MKKTALLLVILFTISFLLSGCFSVLLNAINGDYDQETENDLYMEEQQMMEEQAMTEAYHTEVENAIAAAIPQAPAENDPIGMVTEGENIAEMIYQRAYYEVVSSAGNTCTVLVTAPDMQTIYWDAFYQATANYNGNDIQYIEEMETILMNIIYTQLEAGNYPVRQVQLELELINGQPQFTYEFADAMYGGMMTVWQEFVRAYEEG